MICKQCGKELDGVFTTKHKRVCADCKKLNKLKIDRKYYDTHGDAMRESMKRRYIKKSVPTGTRTKSSDLKYCEKQRGVDDLGCLECQLPNCVQVAFYRGETENSTGFKQRYEQLRETTWKAIEQELDVQTELNMLIGRTPIAGNGRNKYVRNNRGRR